MNEVTLEAYKFGATSAITESFAEQFAIEPRIDFDSSLIADHLFIAITQRVLGEHLKYIRFPKNWVEAIKERWFPLWALKRWPVKYSLIDVVALYPKISLPEHTFSIQAIIQ